jgi:hypothetical protein
MKVLIDNYRKFEINFDTDTDEFYSVSDYYDTEVKKKSFASSKKAIDDFIKANSEFKPFDVVPTYGNSSYKKAGKIIGIRKDKRFIIQYENGETGQVSEYDEKDYALPNEANEAIYAELNSIQLQIEGMKAKKDELAKTLQYTLLRDYKKTLDI